MKIITTVTDCLHLFAHPVEEPGLRGAAVASHCLGPNDGAGDRGASTTLHCQKAAHPGCNGCQEEKTTELLSILHLV